MKVIASVVTFSALSICGLISAFAGAAAPTSVVRAWFPIEVGDRWVYQHEQFDAGPNGMADPRIERWKTEEIVASVSDVPEGTLVGRRVRGYDHEMLNGWLKDNDSVANLDPLERVLIRRNCVYSDKDRDNPPAFCFPMTVGGAWGRTRETDRAENEVYKVLALNGDPFGVANGQTYHAAAHEGAGYYRDVWYAKGIGMVQSVGIHHGTYWEDRTQLLSTTFAGKTSKYSLKPARTAPLSDLDCNGLGWRHYVRTDGAAFVSWEDCMATVRRVPR